ncbi:MAG TPA: PBP1A family penicillin-binding protein [Kofleriaceae bacterium]|nr:PBP1A family penicillin-binding protein [Kofleriaceae bacterium]
MAELIREDLPTRARARVVIANRRDGGILYWVGKLYGFSFFCVVVVALITGVSIYSHFAGNAPPTPDLAGYSRAAPGVTRVYANDGTLLGEWASEWREVVAYDDIPKQLIDAFVATEDHDFFHHNGIYFRGIMRAVWANLVAGDFAQGGSTITQQVCKQFLGNEKSLDRKAKEAICARRVEARYSKKAILATYLNQIFLGSGAYGVAAAAQRFFGKKLSQLDLGEMATIAGLAQAPTRYSPLTHKDRAEARRDEVLDKMVRYGAITEAEAAPFRHTKLVVHATEEIFPRRHPYYAEYVKEYVRKKYGDDALERDGLVIETALEPTTDALAYENAEFGARKQDKRQGWRGPEAYLEGHAREVFLERAAKLYGDGPLQPERRYLALVDKVQSDGALVRIGARSFSLPLHNANWAHRWSQRDFVNDQKTSNLTNALRDGDVIWVSAEPPPRGRFRDWEIPDGHNPHWMSSEEPEEAGRRMRRRDDGLERVLLDQVPHPQAAIFTADHGTGYVVAMVGGSDYLRSQYNRAAQACRQPGSTYKPIYYSLALDEGYGYETMLDDRPIELTDPITGQVWRPENLHGTMDSEVTLEYALVFSKNIPSVQIFKRVGADNVARWARRLGFTTEIIADDALALGASCTRLPELTRAFAIFARNGRWIDWVTVRRIRDRTGRLIEDNTVPQDPQLHAADRFDRVAATAGTAPRQAIPARAAYLTSKLLHTAIEHGFSQVLRSTEIQAAGKTGTSSATMDTSFVGYTSRWITTVWMGDDMRERPLGKDDAAYMTVVPLWSRYMYEAARDQPNLEIPWEVPAGVASSDRGDHRGRTLGRSDLVYKRPPKPGEADYPFPVPPGGTDTSPGG